MIETDWYEEFEHAKEPVVTFVGNSVYINGAEIKLGQCLLDDIKTIQFCIDKIMEIIFHPETVIVFVPEDCDVDTAYITNYNSLVKVVFYGNSFESGTVTGIAARDDGEEYKLSFNSKFPIPKEIADALNDCAGRGIFVSKG